MRYVFDQNEIADVLNRGFVKVANGLKSYDINKPLAPWIATVMVNESLDYVRRTMRAKAKEETYRLEMHTINQVDYNLADLNFDADYLLETLNILSPRTRTVFNLYAIDGYSHKEIAAQLNISVGTSKWHVSSAREQLQKKLLSKEEKRKISSR